jgi:hypothetical protein
MQSGKTGTCRYVVHALQHLSPPPGWDDSKFTPDNMYFICGMNDNDLRSQAIHEFQGLIPEENILFSKQLQKINRQSESRTVSFVIVDESHYASFRSSQVDIFLQNVRTEDILTLSVSATAMAELASCTVASCKGQVYLRPGPGYYSIHDLFNNNLIHQSIDITKEQTKFIDLVVQEYEFQRDHADYKYNIVRLPNLWYHKDLEDDLAELDLQVEFINHHTYVSMKVDDFNTYTVNPPKRFTIIWIYGCLRAGKQLNTEHIGFVHDTASSGPDIIAQSLLGRILGYNKHRNHVKCYTDVTSAKLMRRWITSAYDIMQIPMGSKGIVGGFAEIDRQWALHTPYAIVMDTNMRSYYRSLKQKHANRYPYKQDLFIDLILSATTDREDINNIFETYQPGHCGGLMILTEDNKLKSYNDHWVHNYNAYLDGKFVHCCDITDQRPGKYFYVYVNLNIYSIEYGVALITYKEHIELGGDCERAAVQVKNTSRFCPVLHKS